MVKTKIILALVALPMAGSLMAQNLSEIRPVLTGAPFLRISPDARAGGIGDQGVATTTDNFSQFWNAAKYPFSHISSGVGFTYTPYMSKITNDVFLLYGSYHRFIGDEDRSTISASLYYFNMGSVDLTRLVGTQVVPEGTAKPNEFSIDVAYGLKLADNFSMAVTGRYIRSDLGASFNTNSTLRAANSFAVDISGYFISPTHTSLGNYEGRARAGFSVQNLGPRLDYTGNDDSRSYLPTAARLGAGYDLYLDDSNRIGITVEGSKLLVPGPEITGFNVLREPIYALPNVGVLEGVSKSFKNPKSVMLSGALEYEYEDLFAVRTGYFHESAEQGGRQYATVGVGVKYNSFGLDASYLINTSKVNTALDNTLRIGLTWNIGEETSNVDDY